MKRVKVNKTIVETYGMDNERYNHNAVGKNRNSMV